MIETAGETTSYESEESRPLGKSPSGLQAHWTKEMTSARKRLRQWTNQGNKIVKRYLDERFSANDIDRYTTEAPFRLNLFHTNVTTLMSMLYGSVPKIEVGREHHDPDDDVARVASVMFQRILDVDVASSGSDLATALKASLQDRLLPGMGVARVRYEAEFEVVQAEVIDINTGEAVVEESEQLSYENAPVEYVHWQDFRWGWGRTWKEVPWVAYRAWMSKDECTERFGENVCKNLEFKNQLPSGNDENQDLTDPDQKDNVQKAEIWEVWCKESEKVYWYSEGAPLILDCQDDPLELSGFFPSPQPLMANLTTTMFVPRADFIIAQDLYNEIDELQSRVAIITRAVKVVGVYDKNAGDSVGRMLKEGTENDLIPVDNWAMFAEKGGLKGQIDWFPVQDVVGTLQILISIRDQTIELLYQVTGMSDILRGANTDQYAAAGTQQLKAKMGSIRVQALQDQFARFASELDEIKCEVISKHYSQQTIMQQSSAQFLPMADRDKIGPAIQLMQSQECKWRVDIRPESLAMVDYAQLKQERSEFLNAMATYIQSAQAAAKAMPGSLPVLMEMLKWGMAGFKGSNYLEGIMDQAIQTAQDAEKQAQQNPQPDPQQQMMQAQMQMEMQKIQAKSQADMQLTQTKLQGEMQKNMAVHQQRMEQEQARGAADTQKIMADLQADLQLIAAKLDASLQEEVAQAQNAAAELQVDHEHTLIEMEEEHQNATLEARQQNRETNPD